MLIFAFINFSTFPFVTVLTATEFNFCIIAKINVGGVSSYCFIHFLSIFRACKIKENILTFTMIFESQRTYFLPKIQNMDLFWAKKSIIISYVNI